MEVCAEQLRQDIRLYLTQYSSAGSGYLSWTMASRVSRDETDQEQLNTLNEEAALRQVREGPFLNEQASSCS